MSAVEGMLKMMTDASAKGLRLAVGSPAKMMDAAGSPQDASSHPLTRQEILQLVGPIIPEHARRRLPQETSVEFDHASPSGAFKVTILRNGSEIAVSIVPDPNRGVRRLQRAPVQPPTSRRPQCRRTRRTPPAPVTASRHPLHPLALRDRCALRSIACSDLMVEVEGLRPASVLGNAAAHPQGRQDPAARGGRRADHACGNGRAARPDHAAAEPRRVRAGATTPTSPTRSRASRVSAPTCSSIARAAAPCSASFPRRS